MHWKVKASLQRALDLAPGGDRAYLAMQVHAGRLRHLTALGRASAGAKIEAALCDAGGSVVDSGLVEIGTGWAPVLPMYFWLLGAHSCHTYDLKRLLLDDLVLRSMRDLRTSADSGALHELMPDRTIRGDRLGLLATLLSAPSGPSGILGAMGIHYHAPADAATTRLPAHSIDVLFSNMVLEHVDVEVLGDLWREARRVLRPGGLMVHLVDMSDHYSHGDCRITATHFLRLTDAEYARYNTRFMHQNRLREPEWRAVARRQGFGVRVWRPHVDARALAAYRHADVAPRFAGFTPEQNCTTSLTMVLAPV